MTREVPAGPKALSLMLGWRCNAACVQCWQMVARRRHQINEAELSVRHVVDLMTRYKSVLRYVELCSFGEPTIHPGFMGIVDEIATWPVMHEEDSAVNLITNGSVLEKVQRICDLPGQLTVSFDAPDRAVYEGIRRGLLYDSVLDGIKLVGQRSNHARRYIGINMVVIERNAHLVYDMAALLSGLGSISYLAILRGANLAMTDVPDEEVAADDYRVVEQLGRIRSDYPNLLLNDYFTVRGGGAPTSRCDIPWKSMDVDNAGEAHPCCRSHEVKLGNISDCDPWVSEKMQRLREQIEAGVIDQVEFPPCHSCSLLWG